MQDGAASTPGVARGIAAGALGENFRNTAALMISDGDQGPAKGDDQLQVVYLVVQETGTPIVLMSMRNSGGAKTKLKTKKEAPQRRSQSQTLGCLAHLQQKLTPSSEFSAAIQGCQFECVLGH